MFRVIVCAALLLSGCAYDAAPKQAVRTKIVEKHRTCPTAQRVEDECATKKHCTKDTMTCAEAYYRLTTCGHSWLDGGVAIPRDGQPNGIPCEDVCGKSAKSMTDAIKRAPFSPRMTTSTDCKS
jgi:hypothetical protein